MTNKHHLVAENDMAKADKSSGDIVKCQVIKWLSNLAD